MDISQAEFPFPAGRQPGSQAAGSSGGCHHAAAEVRPEVVARARQLILDQEYPSDQIIRRISEVLAARFDSETGDAGG